MQTIGDGRLKQQKERILQLWEERSLKEVPSARLSESPVLRDSLPVYIDHLSKALAENRKLDVHSVNIHDAEAIRIGRRHGADRADNTGYVLTEVIFEYHILREVIFQVLESDGPITLLERDIILDSIEQAVNDAAVKFSEIHSEIQQKFIETLTHDLKSPITSAKMNAQLMQRTESPESRLKLSNRIVSSLNRLESMIHDLLDAGRVRAGELLALQFVECKLAEVVHEVVVDMTLMHGDRFVFESDYVATGVWGCDGVRRAVENLLGNAVKYGTEGTTITVSMKQRSGFVEITVHNEGLPIAENEVPFLFRQHHRAETVNDGAKAGWGLGLTVVKGVVEAHGGSIHVDSSQEGGTSFILSLSMDENRMPSSLRSEPVATFKSGDSVRPIQN